MKWFHNTNKTMQEMPLTPTALNVVNEGVLVARHAALSQYRPQGCEDHQGRIARLPLASLVGRGGSNSCYRNAAKLATKDLNTACCD